MDIPFAVQQFIQNPGKENKYEDQFGDALKGTGMHLLNYV